MCNQSCYDFGKARLKAEDVTDKRVLEIGSRDVNGSLRQIIEKFKPASYVGIDIENGPGVDEICSVFNVFERFGKESFDLVVSTEMLEHIRDWRAAVSQFKRVLRAGGALLITTRSKGFPYHEYPGDFWRFEIDDMRNIFSDMQIEALEPDSTEPGVFIKAKKTRSFEEKNLSDYALYSMVKQKKCKQITSLDMLYFKLDNLLIQRARNSYGYRMQKQKD
jgi:SAM-dependent methyltransferase